MPTTYQTHVTETPSDKGFLEEIEEFWIVAPAAVRTVSAMRSTLSESQPVSLGSSSAARNAASRTRVLLPPGRLFESIPKPNATIRSITNSTLMRKRHRSSH
jgi:hypothetical protein